jgi:hypothetical protein
LVVLLLACVLWIPTWLYPPLTEADLQGVSDVAKVQELKAARLKLQNDTRTILLQGFGAVLFLTGAAISYSVALRQRRLAQMQEEETRRLFREEVSAKLRQPIEDLTGSSAAVDSYLVELGSPLVTGRSAPSKEEIKQEVEVAVNAVQDRLERIEQRFPEEATLDKVASVNDAIFATKIERLEKSIENLDSKMLTKWDVATILMTILGAITGLAGTIFAVANFVLK